MIDFFDNLEQLLANQTQLDNAEGFKNVAWSMERRLVKMTILPLISDREFPDDMRQTIMRAIAIDGIYPGTSSLKVLPRTLERATLLRKSLLFASLHKLFHELGNRLTHTRFGLLTNSPDQDLKSREFHDSEIFRLFQEKAPS